jgi:hypothetical protein
MRSRLNAPFSVISFPAEINYSHPLHQYNLAHDHNNYFGILHRVFKNGGLKSEPTLLAGEKDNAAHLVSFYTSRILGCPKTCMDGAGFYFE